MAIMRDELPNTQVVILSLSSPDLADGLMRGKIASPSSAMNATRPGSSSPQLTDEPLIVLMPADHRLAGHREWRRG
jgi:LysR family transcriptional regulator, hca operon transcriptional activator